MSLFRTIIICAVLALFSSCEALQQLANQNQGGNGGGNNQQGGGNTVLQGEIECNSNNRYANTIFPANKVKIFKDVPYASMTKQDQWNNGNVTTNCYGSKPYRKIKSDGTQELQLDIFMPDPSVDNCANRALIILVHPGGFSQLKTPNKADVAARAKFMAQMGYVVATIDYRKGFDFGQNSTFIEGSLANLVFPTVDVNCKVNQVPDPNSFHVAMFRFIQDIRASHRFLHKNSDKIGIDIKKIFYAGLSTGAIGIAHAAYASDEEAHWAKLGLGSIESFGNHPELENQIRIAGVLAEQPALQKIEWLEASDNVPIYMMHGAKDKDVPYEIGSLAGITMYNGSKSVQTLAPFKLYGSKAMYDKFNTFNGNTLSIGHLSGFEGINHYITPMTNGQCPNLRGGLRGIWMDAYKFAKNIIDAKDNGSTPNISTGYCLYKNPTKGNCNKVCQ